jgi:exonuclease VII small subunit
MTHPLVVKAKSELEQAQSQLETALRAWDSSVAELWRTSLALTQAQKPVTHAHELLRDALERGPQQISVVLGGLAFFPFSPISA